MKKIILLVLLPVLVSSCLKEGSNHIKYSGYININTLIVPDTGFVGEDVEIKVTGGAPNGCWSDLELTMQKENDTLYNIVGVGIYESWDGLCTDIYPLVDSTFTFEPSKAGIYKFVAYSSNNVRLIDTLHVVTQE